jgi:hypothetical protein
MKSFVFFAGLAAALGLAAVPAHAIPRTFVASNGAGAACTRAAPCATFQAAHNATDPDGEVNCVDAGDFGPVTITKSITFDCAGTAGAIEGASGSAGVLIATAGVTVRLRNLTIEASANPGSDGIVFTDGAALIVQNCIIKNANGSGINFAPPGTARLLVSGSIISANSFHGILISTTSSTSARLVLDGVRLERNGFGVTLTGTGSLIAHVRDSIATMNLNDNFRIIGPSSGVASVTLDRTSSTLANANGVFSSGTLTFITIGRSTVISNVNGLVADGGGHILSYRNNHLNGNVTDGAPTSTLTLK